MIIEFYDISAEGKPMIKEVHGVSRIPEIGDIFEFDVSPYVVNHWKVMSPIIFGYCPKPIPEKINHKEYCKVRVTKLKVIEEITKLCAKSDCHRPRLISSRYCFEHHQEIIGSDLKDVIGKCEKSNCEKICDPRSVYCQEQSILPRSSK